MHDPKASSTRRAAGRAGACVLAAGVVAVLLGACTPEPPAPPVSAPTPPVEEPAGAAAAGRDVELVLPPRTALDPNVIDGMSDRFRSLSEDLPDGVDSLAVRLPEEPAFVPDLLELVATRGAGLVCVLGVDVESVADRTAVRHGASTVCALPAALPELDGEGGFEPTPAVRVDVPVTELGILVGTAARAAALAAVSQEEADTAADDEDGIDDVDPDDGEPGPPIVPRPRVGLVLLGDELPTDRLREGLLTGLAEVEVVAAEDPDATPQEAVETVLAAGAQVVIVDGGPGAAEVVAASSGRAALLAPVDVLAGADVTGAVLGYRLRWEQVVRVLLDSFAGAGQLRAPVLLGLGDEVLQLEVGLEHGEVLTAIEDVRSQLAARDDPRAPLVDEGPPGEAP
jgi:hypothetical protein